MTPAILYAMIKRMEDEERKKELIRQKFQRDLLYRRNQPGVQPGNPMQDPRTLSPWEQRRYNSIPLTPQGPAWDPRQTQQPPPHAPAHVPQWVGNYLQMVAQAPQGQQQLPPTATTGIRG